MLVRAHHLGPPSVCNRKLMARVLSGEDKIAIMSERKTPKVKRPGIYVDNDISVKT